MRLILIERARNEEVNESVLFCTDYWIRYEKYTKNYGMYFNTVNHDLPEHFITEASVVAILKEQGYIWDSGMDKNMQIAPILEAMKNKKEVENG